MIYIEKDKTNKFVLTLTEVSKLQNPFYIFVFKNEFILDSDQIIFSTPDISGHTNRFNLFQLIESEQGSTTGGYDEALNLVAGQWSYTVYEADIQTLDLSQTTGTILEEGRMIVNGITNGFNLNTSDSIYI